MTVVLLEKEAKLVLMYVWLFLCVKAISSVEGKIKKAMSVEK